MAKAMSVQMFAEDDTLSVASAALSEAPSGAYSCPPVPLRRRSKMKKSAAPSPPAKVTTPLSASTDSSAGSNHSLSYLTSSAPPMGGQHLSDDCAINELLEGRMDLEVHLPDGRIVKMNVERRTPMMDLLVQVTTPNKISPGGHAIHILTDRGKDFIHYKPSTPIGSLDTHSIHIVPKSSLIDPPVKKMPKVVNKPFETTFRLQVNLPRSQMVVYRVSPRTTLAEIKQMACRDKNLDHSKYQLVHPQYANQILDLNSPLSTFGCTEISLMSNSNISANIRNSTSDLIAYTAREDDKKKKGLLGLFSRKKSKGSVVDSSSDSMDSRGVSPSRSDSSGPNQRVTNKVSIKKRPAPHPPTLQQQPEIKSTESLTTKTPPPILEDAAEATLDGSGSTVSHSRHSSDSSGYHEASLLSESPDHLSPDVCSGSGSSALSADSAIAQTSTPNKTNRKISTPVKPTQPKPRIIKSSLSESSLLTAASKKRKAPPPPILSRSMDEQKMVSEHSIPDKIVEEPVNEDVNVIESTQVVEVHTTPIDETVKASAEKAEGDEFDATDAVTPTKPNRSISEVTDALPVTTDHHILGDTTTPPVSEPMERLEAKLVFDDEYDDYDDDDDDPPAETSGTISPSKPGAAISLEDDDLDDNWFSEDSSLVAPPPAFVNPSLLAANIPLDDLEERDRFIDSIPTPPIRNSKLNQRSSTPRKTNKLARDELVRQPSLTSLRTIDDVQNSFDITIAEAERVLEEENRLSLSDSSSLRTEETSEDKIEAPADSPKKNFSPEFVASQERILSQIEAAFNLVEAQADEPLPPQPTPTPAPEDDLGWEYPIPDPPPAFRNDELLVETPPPSPSLATITPSTFNDERDKVTQLEEDEEDRIRSSSHSSDSSGEGIPPPLPVSPPPSLQNTLTEYEEIEAYSDSLRIQAENQLYMPKPRRAPLLNFTIGSYKKQQEDIYGSIGKNAGQNVPRPLLVQQTSREDQPQSNRSSFSSYETVPEYSDQTPDNTESKRIRFAENRLPAFELNEGLGANQLYGLEGSVRGIKGQVKLICAEMAESGASPNLVGRSASVLCLAPPLKFSSSSTNEAQRKQVQRANTTLEKIRKSQSVQELNGVQEGENDDPKSREEEQVKLQNEYLKLHQQFLNWNKQLIENQSILEQQNIVVTEQPKFASLNDTAASSQQIDDIKCQTLPRQKSKNIEAPLEEKRTFTFGRQEPRPKSQVLTNVTIGSWQQRKPSENGVGQLASKFQSMENVNRLPSIEDEKPPRPLRPNSIHIGSSWLKKSHTTDAQDETNRGKIDVQINGVQHQPVSLRSSSAKKDFKVPEVRHSSIVRQRIPPEEIKAPGPASEQSSYKKYIFGSECNNNTNYNNNNIVANSKTVTYLNHTQKESVNGETKTVQMNGKSNGVAFRPSFSNKAVPKVIGFKINEVNASKTSGTTHEPVEVKSNGVIVHEVKSNGIKYESKSNGYSKPNNKSLPTQVPINNPPVPPPLPSELTAGLAGLKSVSNRGKSRTILPPPKLDPREELMLEIRNFGGRVALRKDVIKTGGS